MKKVLSLVAVAGLCVSSVNASIITETITVAQQSVTEGGSTTAGLDFVGNQFNSALGTLNNVTLSLTANLGNSVVGAIRTSPGVDSWNIHWNYGGSVTLSSIPLSSSWSGAGTNSVNPQPSGSFQPFAIGLTDPSATTLVLTSGLAQFTGNSTFDLAALLQAADTWGAEAGDGEFSNFQPKAGATLDVTFDFTPVPETTTLVAGALMLLPFGVSTLRIVRKQRAA